MHDEYDVVIVGSGIAGAMVAKQLTLAGKKVVMLEAGPGFDLDDNKNLDRYFNAFNKFPSSAYVPDIHQGGKLTNPTSLNAPRPILLTLNNKNWQSPSESYFIQKGPLAFASTYERMAGGTARLWLGASIRHLPSDFQAKTIYGVHRDWPISYSDISKWYDKAEHEMGVSGNTEEQSYSGLTFSKDYLYPMPGIERTLIDQMIERGVDGMMVEGKRLNVTGTPLAVNSRPYHGRPACSGHSSCIPICPSQSKYDPRRTLKDALDTGNLDLFHHTVAYDIVVEENGNVSEIKYKYYDEPQGPVTYEGSVKAKIFVLAANGIETPKLLLMSKNNGSTPNGVANSSDQVGRNLMDHPLYLAWGLSQEPVYPYRGPLSTAGIENLRDGVFRKERGAFRIEIGNAGWNFPYQDPKTTTLDFINGTNMTGTNPGKLSLSGSDLSSALHNILTRQFHLTFEVEQSPEDSNRVTLSEVRDNLNIPRPQINYNISDYTKKGLLAAKRIADSIFSNCNALQYTTWPFPEGPTSFEVDYDGTPQKLAFFGGGHIAGTYCMGSDKRKSVVDSDQRSWDHKNLFLLGSGVFPTIATANPTLTIAALSLWAADTILTKDLK